MWVKAIRSKSKKDLHNSSNNESTKKPKKNLFAKVFRVTRVLNAFKAKKHVEKSDFEYIPKEISTDVPTQVIQRPPFTNTLSPNYKFSQFSKVDHKKKYIYIFKIF